MDESSSARRRYHFNTTSENPAAETTYNGSSWGSLRQKRQNISLNKSQTPADYNKSIVSPKSKNVIKIDPRIIADVQSKGLASRIVKYHENGTRLNRSMSAHNLSTKPGQFPSVTLKKTGLPYRATKQELSMIRIPAPEKSSFYGNTISSLLKSSSVVGLQSKRNEELSRENRPIIHPPPTVNDMEPTRSVLDVLKEISRKRINSDDLEADETSKKYCNRAVGDFVDASNNATSCQRNKRQRDYITSHQSISLSETIKTSPEQQAKKRVCSYNNDITSSLSSSIKCKAYENSKRMLPSHNLNQTMPTNLELYEMQKPKTQIYSQSNNNNNNFGLDVRFDNLQSSLSMADSQKPITPTSTNTCVYDQCNIEGISPTRTVSEHLHNPEQKIAKNLSETANKPRLTLFNKKCDDESIKINDSAESLAENSDDLNDFGECASIPFVKPKKLSSISSLRNPIIERTQKSKLALMLSGLRGELYQNVDADVLDASAKKIETREEIKATNTNDNAVISAMETTRTVTTLTTVISASSSGVLNTSSTLPLTTNTKSSTLSPILAVNSANKTTSPLVGLKLSQPKTETTNDTSRSDAAKATETNLKSNVPVLSGFSFGITNINPTPLTNTISDDPKNSKSVTISSSAVKANTATNTIKTLNFANTPQLNSTFMSTTDNNTAKLVMHSPMTKENNSQLPTISNALTTPLPKTISTASTSTSTTYLTANNNFTFGTTVSETPAASVTTFNSTAKQNNNFQFTNPASSSPNTVSAAVTSSNSSIAVAGPTTSALTFATVSTPALSASSTTTKSFSFNSPNQSTKSETKTSANASHGSLNLNSNLNVLSLPSFGTANASIKAQPTNSPFSFGTKTNEPNSILGDRNKSPTVNKTENVFGSNTSAIFGSSNFNASVTGEPATAFGNNAASSSAKNIFNSPNTTSLFGLSSTKLDTQEFGSKIDKPAISATPSVFGSNATTNNGTPTTFGFGSKPSIPQITNINNGSNSSGGGFSFSSAILNSPEGSTANVFGIKTSAPTNTTNTFGAGSTSMLQNKSFTFGSGNKVENSSNLFGGVTNKSTESTSQGGFSFGTAIAPKTSSFIHGDGNSFSGSNVSGTNTSVGFSFSGASKPNEPSLSNKLFSFGSPQPSQQQQQTKSMPNNNANASNIFGSSCVSKTASQPAFNFNVGSSTNLQTSTPVSNNIFSPPSNVTTGPGDRLIRRATRRLQK